MRSGWERRDRDGPATFGAREAGGAALAFLLAGEGIAGGKVWIGEEGRVEGGGGHGGDGGRGEGGNELISIDLSSIS